MSAADRRAAAGRVCVYCGDARLDGHQRPEHPIPEVLDSAITVYTVCDDCNARAGREVDQPWLDDPLVRAERQRWKPRGRRHKLAAGGHPWLDGVYEDEDGHRVVVRDGMPTYPGSIQRAADEITIAASTPERAQELRDRVGRQLAARGQRMLDYTQGRRRRRPRLQRTLAVSLTLGVRMGAKLALAFGGEAYDEGWRTSEQARLLRRWLWSEHPENEAGERLAWIARRGDDHPLAQPPNHVVHFGIVGEEVVLCALVFGTLGFTVPVAPLATKLPDIAWCSGPAHGADVLTTRSALLTEAVMRAVS